MDFAECIRTRRSVRKFQDRPVSRENLIRIVDLARFAPSWKNTQTAAYLAVTDPERKAEMAETCVPTPHNREIIRSAPAVIVVTTERNRSGYDADGTAGETGTHWESFDAGIAAQTFCLAAHGLGFATVILGMFHQDRVAELVQLPADRSVSALIALGYAGEHPEARPRKTAEELLTVL